MSTEKKISDIIFDMQTKINQLVGLYTNMDNNIKIILNRLNTQSKNNNLTENKQAIRSAGSLSVSAIGVAPAVKLPPGPPIKEPEPEFDNDVLVARPFDESFDDDERELIEEVIPKGKRRDLRKPADSTQGTKVAVSQQIQYNSGKVLFLANVEIIDVSSGQIVKQTRTNQKGRWIAPLDPGEYLIHISKRQVDKNKLPVELRYKIAVPNSSGPLELPTTEIPDNTQSPINL
jgi:hypothetical protein